MKSSLYSLIPFLPLFCNCQFRRIDSIQFICSQAPIPAGWRLETRLDSMLLLPASELFLITTLHGPRRKHCLSIVDNACLQRRCIATEAIGLLLAYSLPRNVFTESLPSNERLSWFLYSDFRASCHGTYIRPRLVLSISFPTYHSVIILTFGSI
jgi:hypothetical protein